MLKKLILSSFLIINFFIRANDEIKLPNNNENYKLWQTTEHFRESSGITIIKIIRSVTLKDYTELKLEVIDVAKKNDISFIPKYNDIENLTTIGDVTYKTRPAAGYLKYDYEIESAVMTIYTSNIHDKVELYTKLKDYVNLSDNQIEKLARKQQQTPKLKIVKSKTSSGIPYENITIPGNNDDFFYHGYLIINELKKLGYSINSLAEDGKRNLIKGLLFSDNFKNLYVWYDETKSQTTCFVYDGIIVQEDSLDQSINNKFSKMNQ